MECCEVKESNVNAGQWCRTTLVLTAAVEQVAAKETLEGTVKRMEKQALTQNTIYSVFPSTSGVLNH